MYQRSWALDPPVDSRARDKPDPKITQLILTTPTKGEPLIASPRSDHTAAPSGYCSARRSSLRQRFDGGATPLPRTFGLETEVTNPSPPGRNPVADRPEITPIGVLLIEPPHDIGSHADEGAKSRGRANAVFRPFHAPPKTSAICLK